MLNQGLNVVVAEHTRRYRGRATSAGGPQKERGLAMKRILIVAACLLISACTTVNSQMAVKEAIRAPQPSAKVLLMGPDVQLALLTASGIQQPRADWSAQGRDGLATEISKALAAKSHPIERVDAALAMEGRTGQLLRLHEAVGQSITLGYGMLPSKKGSFDWTLGEGTSVIASDRGAEYALFITARGTYASSGRMVMMLAAAAMGVSVPLGQQLVYASLVDLKTGRVVWFNTALAGPSADIRTPEGASALVASLMKGVPL